MLTNSFVINIVQNVEQLVNPYTSTITAVEYIRQLKTVKYTQDFFRHYRQKFIAVQSLDEAIKQKIFCLLSSA